MKSRDRSTYNPSVDICLLNAVDCPMTDRETEQIRRDTQTILLRRVSVCLVNATSPQVTVRACVTHAHFGTLGTDSPIAAAAAAAAGWVAR